VANAEAATRVPAIKWQDHDFHARQVGTKDMCRIVSIDVDKDTIRLVTHSGLRINQVLSETELDVAMTV